MDFSEAALRKDCPHCNPKSFALKYPLRETDRFYIVCDVHPLTKGHLLIIPKEHLSCIAEFPEPVYREFLDLFKTCSDFLVTQYGSVSSFEHGKIGQTVFHSHVQMFPFRGDLKTIIPEGEAYLTPLEGFDGLKTKLARDNGYLFFSIGDGKWTVDPKIGRPRFFRDRFAGALGQPDRGNWKEMHENTQLMAEAENDINNLIASWATFSLTTI